MESSLHQSNTYHISSTITTTTPTVISILLNQPAWWYVILKYGNTIYVWPIQLSWHQHATDLNGGRTTGSWRIVRAGAPQISPADGFSSDQYIHSYQVCIYLSILTHLVYFHRIYIHKYQHQVYFHMFKIQMCKFSEECWQSQNHKAKDTTEKVNIIFSFL